MTEKTGIIYLQKDRFHLYSPYLSNILEFRFVPEISLDFDLFNKPMFENLLKAFVVNNKIPAGNFIIVIADNASFIKDFVLTQTPQAVSTLENLQTQANEFIEHVPFEEVLGKTYPLSNGLRAYATNKEMFDTIKLTLENLGFILTLVIPGFVFGPEVSAAPTLNINNINIILQKINLLKEYNLLTLTASAEKLAISSETEEKENTSERTVSQGKPENKRLVLIIGISVISLIFIVTGIILYLQFTYRPYNSKAVTITPTPPASAVISPKTTPNITPVVLAAKDLTVQIISASTSATINTIRTALAKYGFKSVDEQNQQNLGVSSNLLMFSERVDTETKTDVSFDVRTIVPDILVQEKNDGAFDIIVIIGK